MMEFCRQAAVICIIAVLAGLPSRVQAQTPGELQDHDDSLDVYAVKFVKTRYFFWRWSGYGIYLGRGAVLTAAHVVGRWPSLTNPRVVIAGQEIPVTVVRKGVVERTDLALVTFDETLLPVNLRMRRNPVCKDWPRSGESVVVVVPQQTQRSKVLSPLVVAPPFRRRFGTVIADVRIALSGSGIFRASTKCLLGITSRWLEKYPPSKEKPQNGDVERVKYFVPAPVITKFLPPEYRF